MTLLSLVSHESYGDSARSSVGVYSPFERVLLEPWAAVASTEIARFQASSALSYRGFLYLRSVSYVVPFIRIRNLTPWGIKRCRHRPAWSSPWLDVFKSDDWKQDSDETISNPHEGFQGPSRVSKPGSSACRISTLPVNLNFRGFPRETTPTHSLHRSDWSVCLSSP